MRKLLVVAVLAGVVAMAAPLPAQTHVPAGTPIVIVLNHSVSSKTARPGQTISASVARSVMIDEKAVIPRGAEASVHVASVQASGRLSTPAKLYLRLDAVTVRGTTYPVSAHLAGSKGKSHATRDTEAIGGGAAGGAIIGALAGGGKGAAIGAGIGAGAGTVGAAATGKKDITYGAETKLTFTLKSGVTIK